MNNYFLKYNQFTSSIKKYPINTCKQHRSGFMVDLLSVRKDNNCTIRVEIRFKVGQKDNKNLNPIVELASSKLQASGSIVTNIDCGTLKQALANATCNIHCILENGTCHKTVICADLSIEISENQINIIKSMKGINGNSPYYGADAVSSEGKSVTCYKSIDPTQKFMS